MNINSDNPVVVVGLGILFIVGLIPFIFYGLFLFGRWVYNLIFRDKSIDEEFKKKSDKSKIKKNRV